MHPEALPIFPIAGSWDILKISWSDPDPRWWASAMLQLDGALWRTCPFLTKNAPSNRQFQNVSYPFMWLLMPSLDGSKPIIIMSNFRWVNIKIDRFLSRVHPDIRVPIFQLSVLRSHTWSVAMWSPAWRWTSLDWQFRPFSSARDAETAEALRVCEISADPEMNQHLQGIPTWNDESCRVLLMALAVFKGRSLGSFFGGWDGQGLNPCMRHAGASCCARKKRTRSKADDAARCWNGMRSGCTMMIYIYIIIYGGVLNWRYPQIIYVIFGFFIIHLTKNKINHPAHGAAPWLWTPPEPGHHDFVPTQMLRILQLKPIENQNTADLDKEFFQWRWHAMAMGMGQVTCEVTRND